MAATKNSLVTPKTPSHIRIGITNTSTQVLAHIKKVMLTLNQTLQKTAQGLLVTVSAKTAQKAQTNRRKQRLPSRALILTENLMQIERIIKKERRHLTTPTRSFSLECNGRLREGLKVLTILATRQLQGRKAMLAI